MDEPVGKKWKRPKWTREMRLKAAEAGRRGGLKGGQLGGLISWGTRTDEQRTEIVQMLRASRQRNRTAKARKAQAARAAKQWADDRRANKPMSAEKAAFLYERGMLKAAPTKPRREDYGSHDEWIAALGAYARKLAGGA